MRPVLLLWLAVALGLTPLRALPAAKLEPKSDSYWLGANPELICARPERIPQASVFMSLLGTPSVNSQRPIKREPDIGYWNELALEMIVKYQRNPLRAARVMTLLNTAMHDALACSRTYKARGVAPLLAVDTAAAHLLEFLFPQEPEGRFQSLALGRQAGLAAADQKGSGDKAREFGWNVALAAIERAINDGTDAVWDVSTRPKPGPGVWRASPPTYSSTPAEPLAGNWRTWVLRDGAEIQPPPPPAYGSAAYWREVEEVRAVTVQLTQAQKSIADRWHLDNGTLTPVGVWNREALALARSQQLTPEQTAKVMAALNVAMMDAFIACWRAKYTFWTERPVTVIRERNDKAFMPYLVTPSFPSYVSGHATVSGAASQVLSEFFPKQRAKLTAMAEEAAVSRLFGGIHFRSDNTEGLKLGRLVADRVLARSRQQANQRR